MNKFDFTLCAMISIAYLLMFWVGPYYVHDVFDNRWFNILALHFVVSVVCFICWLIGYAASKSNYFYK